MRVACQGCGAPLEVEQGNAFAKCAYCGETNRVKGAATLLAERPVAPQPVPRSAPEPPRPAKPARAPGAPIGARVIGCVGPLIALTLGVGIPVWSSWGAEIVAAVPFFGIDPDAEATIGRFELGAAPLPTLRGQAEGRYDAAPLGPGCRGALPSSPQLRLTAAQPTAVRVEVTEARGDPVLAIHTASGAWICDDDSGGGTFPRVVQTLGAGEHAVFVGTFARGDATPFSMSVIAQLTDAPTNDEGVAPGATPTLAAVSVGTGAPSGVWAGRTAGWTAARGLGDGCRGSLPVAPHLRLSASAPTPVRLVTRDATEDLVMAARAPSGHWLCDDDGGGGLNPELDITLMPGDTQVWVGTFHDDRASAFTLELSGPGRGPAGEHGLRPDAAPALGTVNLDMDAWEPRHAGRVRGELDARQLDPTCRGQVGDAPDLVVLTTIPRSVEIEALGRDDLTLLVRLPSGVISCDDDSGEGRDPRVRATLSPGATQVWVGAIGRGARAAPFTLEVREGAP